MQFLAGIWGFFCVCFLSFGGFCIWVFLEGGFFGIIMCLDVLFFMFLVLGFFEFLDQ